MREGKSLDKDLPPNAKTIELDEKEVLEALTAYASERNEEGVVHGIVGGVDVIAQLEVIVFPNKKMRYLLTYWPTN